MLKNTSVILKILHVLSWIIFIGLCIQTGALLYTTFASLVFNPDAAKNLYEGLNLSDLYNFDRWYFAGIMSLIIAVSALKAYIFYQVIKIFLKINMVHPFSTEVAKLITGISYVALEVGIVTIMANGWCDWLIKRGVNLPDLKSHLGEGGEFLFFAAVIFFIGQVFKKGIELQTENELTV